jgi:6-pyruvoyl-tetrahydropterin synthase
MTNMNVPTMSGEDTIFLNNITQIDHAMLVPGRDGATTILGGSLNLSVRLWGTNTANEHVVVDFSAVKKDIKALIDNHTTGFDHKLWVFVPSEPLTDGDIQLMGGDIASIRSVLDNIRLPGVELMNAHGETCSGSHYMEDIGCLYSDKACAEVPHRSIRTLMWPGDWSTLMDELSNLQVNGITKKLYDDSRNPVMTSVRDNIAAYLTKHICLKYPNVTRIDCTLNTQMMFPRPDEGRDYSWGKFRYAHGLKSSSSLGCQNMFHGHLSFVWAESEASGAPGEAALDEVISTIARELDGVVFAKQENMSNRGGAFGGPALAYNCPRGPYSCLIEVLGRFPIVIESETTIENLARFVARRYYTQLTEARVTALYVSEGLTKGSFVTFDYDGE